MRARIRSSTSPSSPALATIRANRAMRGIPAVFVAFVTALGMVACGGSSPSTTSTANFKFNNVVKLAGANWFNRMAVGLEEFSKETGIPVNQTGPAQPTAEGQLSMITNQIAQHPTVIGIVPNDVGASEGVLANARKSGIIVVSQEGATLQNTDFNLEAFDNATFGKDMMDSLAKCMGGSGQYASFVGGLTVSAHMTWVNAALAQAQANYPGITRVGSGPYVSNESEQTAYQATQQILAKYPNIKGFQGSASVDLPGIAKAVQAAGLSGKVCIVGTAEPVLAKQYLESGTVYAGFVWDPALSGKATMYAAKMLAEHKPITAGTDLHVPGYNNIQPCGAGTSPHCFLGAAELQLTKANISQYSF